jgi:hypothetical protein
MVIVAQFLSSIFRRPRARLRAGAIAKREIWLMTAEEKSTMKAACVQAAATLIAARDTGKIQIDVEECITLAALIYVRVVTADWRDA